MTKLTTGNSSNFPSGCSCTLEDVTTYGDSSRGYLPVPDPACKVHRPFLRGKTFSTAILDEAVLVPESIPEVECVRCGKVKPLKSSTWNEHDPRSLGWWCRECRVAAGFEVSSFTVLHTPTRAKVEAEYQKVLRDWVGRRNYD